MPEGAIYSGYLTKFGGATPLSRAHRRFFVLSEDAVLRYYVTDAAKKGVEEKGSIEVRYALLTDRGSFKGAQFVFSLKGVNPSKGMKEYFLAAGSSAERWLWINALLWATGLYPRLFGECSSSRLEEQTCAPSARHNADHPLFALLALPGNDICADCSAPDPGWCVVLTQPTGEALGGVFVCLECAGVHRSLHASACSSLTLDDWTGANSPRGRSLPRILEQGTNAKINAQLEFCCLNDDGQVAVRPTPVCAHNIREKFIRQKYERGQAGEIVGAFSCQRHPDGPPTPAIAQPSESSSPTANELMCGVVQVDQLAKLPIPPRFIGVIFICVQEVRGVPQSLFSNHPVVRVGNGYQSVTTGQGEREGQTITFGKAPNYANGRVQLCVDSVFRPLHFTVYSNHKADDILATAHLCLRGLERRARDGDADSCTQLSLPFTESDNKNATIRLELKFDRMI